MEEIFRPGPAGDGLRTVIAVVADGRLVVVINDADPAGRRRTDLRRGPRDPVAGGLHHAEHLEIRVRATLEQECERLDIAPTYHRNGDRFGTAYRVTADLRGDTGDLRAGVRRRRLPASPELRGRVPCSATPVRGTPRSRAGPRGSRSGRICAVAAARRRGAQAETGGAFALDSWEEPVYVRVDRQDADLVQPEDLTSLAVVCPADLGESELVACVRRAALGDVVPGGTHVMVDVEAIRRMAADRVGPAWPDDLAQMLAYASAKGWCSDDGHRVRAHVVRR